MPKKFLRTGEVAARAGVSVATLRYYERRGLIPEPDRTAGGYREYPPETVDVLRMIHRAKELGFTLREIRALEELRQDPGSSCAAFHDLAQKKRNDLEERIQFLVKSRDTLDGLIERCPRRGAAATDCPILRHLLSDGGA